jgi:hypothetical protein
MRVMDAHSVGCWAAKETAKGPEAEKPRRWARGQARVARSWRSWWWKRDWVGGSRGVEERPWPQRSKRRRWVSTGGEGLVRERMALARGRRLMQGVEPPCMRIARRMLGGSGPACGEDETVLDGVLERR